ncbi:SDR family NAD(P)-dependent oxidoreductase [Nocardia sp. 2YAB30]|uniref:SDR family NAD(P)-dependent oxidoreductase n=1 Tax=unclassified Nocardia TaxID=2637762 RepID=UPI003F9C2D66
MAKTIIVTGSSSGIGRDIARAFVERGDNVVLNGRDESKLADVATGLGVPDRVVTVAGDIGAPTTGTALVRAAVERFGGVDVLVNNAGIFGAKPFVDVTEQDLDSYLNGNLKGTTSPHKPSCGGCASRQEAEPSSTSARC